MYVCNSCCFHFSFISPIVAKHFPFIGGKSPRPSPVNTVVEAWLQFFFLPINLSTIFDVELVRYMMQNQFLVFPQFCAFLQNFKLVFLIDRPTLWLLSLQSKKTVSETFTFDGTWLVFFGLSSPGHFLWVYWTSVSMS